MNVSLREFRATMTVTELELYFFKILLPMMRVPSSTELFLEALRLQKANQIAWYDSLIVAAAIQGVAKFSTAKTCSMAVALGIWSSRIRFFRRRCQLA